MKIHGTLGLLAAVIPALLGTPGNAQELSCAGQVSLAFPQGDLADGRFQDHQPGVGLGLQLGIAFPRGHVIVPRIDFAEFRNAGNGNAVARTLQAGLDYDFYLSTKQVYQGAYLGAGLGYSSTHYRQDTATGPLNNTPSNVYFAAQVGYAFTRHLAAELRYTYVEYTPNSNGAGGTTDSSSTDASLVFRF